MTNVGRMLVAVVVAAVVAVAQPACVFACSCLPPGPPQEALANATAVFAGRVTEVAMPAGGDGSGAVTVTFAVAQSWKGADQATIMLDTPTSSASCGVDFVQGQEYLVYATESEGRLQTNLCSRTTQLANAGDDLTALGPGSAPGGAETPATGAPETPATGAPEAPAELPATGATRPETALAGVALLLMLLGAAVLRRESAGGAR